MTRDTLSDQAPNSQLRGSCSKEAAVGRAGSYLPKQAASSKGGVQEQDDGRKAGLVVIKASCESLRPHQSESPSTQSSPVPLWMRLLLALSRLCAV